MKITFAKKFFATIMAFAIMMPAITLFMAPAYAITEDTLWTGDQTGAPSKDAQNTAMGDLGKEDPRTIVANVIKIIIGFLGIVAVIIILMGGFKWMTAGGNDEKATEAKNLIVAGAIGLLIILAAFGIATFIINSLLGATQSS